MLAVFSSPNPSGSGNAYTVSDGTISNRWGASPNSTNLLHSILVTATQANISIGGYTANTILKSAFGIKLNSVQAAANGVLGTEDTTAILPTVNRLNIGASATSTAQIIGHIRNLTYYPTRLTNAELQALTV